jgi:mannose-6-phosphate isomerase-like protein (cupin superfamily)
MTDSEDFPEGQPDAGNSDRPARIIDPQTAEERPMNRKGGRSIRLVDETVGAETVDLHMNILQPGSEEESPYHLHQKAENVYFVLQGRLGLRLGDERVTVEAGQAVFIPPMLPHSVWNAGEREARLLELYSPPGPDFVRLDEGE